MSALQKVVCKGRSDDVRECGRKKKHGRMDSLCRLLQGPSLGHQIWTSRATVEVVLGG